MANDSKNGGMFVFHIPSKPIINFYCYINGLHIHECGVRGYPFVETISENKNGYSKSQIQYSERVGALFEVAGNQPEGDLRALVGFGVIKNCPVTPEDVDVYLKSIRKTLSVQK